MTLTEENKAIVRRFYAEVVSEGRIDLLDDIAADNMRDETFPPGREGFKQHIRWIRSVFPDFQATVTDLIAEDDRVVALWTAQGTHQDVFLGVAASAKRVTATAISVLRLSNGQITEYRVRFDQYGVLQQFGAVSSLRTFLAS